MLCIFSVNILRAFFTTWHFATAFEAFLLGNSKARRISPSSRRTRDLARAINRKVCRDFGVFPIWPINVDGLRGKVICSNC